jgi:hypothetical protein
MLLRRHCIYDVHTLEKARKNWRYNMSGSYATFFGTHIFGELKGLDLEILNDLLFWSAL